MKVAGQNHFTAKKIERKGMYSRPIAREEWSEESSLRIDELLSLAAGKPGFFLVKHCHCMAPLPILFALYTSVYQITPGCCCTCRDTPSSGGNWQLLSLHTTAIHSRSQSLPSLLQAAEPELFSREKLNFYNFTVLSRCNF